MVSSGVSGSAARSGDRDRMITTVGACLASAYSVGPQRPTEEGLYPFARGGCYIAVPPERSMMSNV